MKPSQHSFNDLFRPLGLTEKQTEDANWAEWIDTMSSRLP
jgi:hypothetical protein